MNAAAIGGSRAIGRSGPGPSLEAGATAVATAFYLILDLSNPYTGFFRPSPAPLDQVLAVMGRQ
jgi:hypothetical protein